MSNSFVDSRLTAPGPKKLLALDGGGIRGLITIEFLERIETLLRHELGKPDLVLADYFDYVSGTSTGAIIATCIALGRSTAEIRDFYLEMGARMFSPAQLLRRFFHRFDETHLERALQEIFGAETTLGSEKLRTLLLVVMLNATTHSAWPLSNNPRAKYNLRTLVDCNLDILLWQLVRASTAAPTYFKPADMDLGENRFTFVDGGVSTCNNPAFQLFLMATLAPYNVGWPVGEDQMLLISVGTGASIRVNTALRAKQMHLLYHARSIPAALLHACAEEQDFLCRVFGKFQGGRALNGEVGDLVDVANPAGPKAFTYVRYDLELTREGLDELGLRHIDPLDVQPLDKVSSLPQLCEVGRTAAQRQVQPAHFSSFHTHH